MLLADTSVWIEHFRKARSTLGDRLAEGIVLIHPAVSGELACGTLKNRDRVLSDLQTLPCVMVATEAEVFHLIESRKLWGRGLGWIDMQLLASSLLTHCFLWTLDKRLAEAATELGLWYSA